MSRSRLGRPCLEPGCRRSAISKRSRCVAHQRAYDRRGRLSTPTSSPLHRQWRRAVLQRDGLCRDCHRPLLDPRGEPLPTAHADHVIPLSLGGTYSLQNGAGRCASCHSRKTLREQRDPFSCLDG